MEKTSASGSTGAHPQNAQRSLLALFGLPKGDPAFTWANLPVKQGIAQHPVLLPHEFFGSMFAEQKALWDKWRHVWMMAWERDRRLKDKLGYLSELEKVKNFNWDEWRKRFLKHNNNKKSRVTDLFRKLDEDADGFLTRDDFIDGILKNKFPRYISFLIKIVIL